MTISIIALAVAVLALVGSYVASRRVGNVIEYVSSQVTHRIEMLRRQLAVDEQIARASRERIVKLEDKRLPVGWEKYVNQQVRNRMNKWVSLINKNH